MLCHKSFPIPILLNNRPQNIIQSVRLNLIHRGEILPELAFWKSLAAEPLQIVYGQLRDVATFVLAEWHPGANQFDEKIRFHK